MKEVAHGERFQGTAQVLSFPLHPRLSLVTSVRILAGVHVCKCICHLENVRVSKSGSLVTTIGTFPEPAILSILDSLEEIFTDDIRLVGYFFRAMFLADDFFELCIVPALHAVFFRFFPCICIDVLFGDLSFDSEIVGELAFVASFAFSLFKVHASEVSQAGRRHVGVTERSLDLCRREPFGAPARA